MFGLEPGAFWMLIGGPIIIIMLMFFKCVLIRKESDE